MTIDFTKDFNVDQLSFTDFEDSKDSTGQKDPAGQRKAFPRYQVNGSNVNPYFQLVWFLLDSYGIPQLGRYYTSDAQRSFVKIPLNTNIPEIKLLVDKLTLLDEYLGSDKFKEQKFGNKSKKYSYQPIVRLPIDDEDDEDTTKVKKIRYPYIKIKIDIDYKTKDVKTIIYNSTLVDSKRVRKEIKDVTTVSDFATHICYLSKIRPIIKPATLWAASPTSTKEPKYGLTLKMIKVEVEPPNGRSSSNTKDYMLSDTFIDDEPQMQNTQQSSSSSSSKPVVQIDDDSDGSDDSEKIVEQKKGVQIIESESESNDSEAEIKPVKKPTPKKANKK